MAVIYHNDVQEDAHARFQQWRKRNPQGFFINRKTIKEGLLHRSTCPHPGGTHWNEEDEGASLTTKPKICAPSVTELLEWAREKKLSLSRCENCDPTEAKAHPRTLMVTWNPKKWHWENLEEQCEQVRKKGFVDEPWTCRHKGVQRGDRVFLLRQGVEPKGIIASGTAVSQTLIGVHFSDPKKKYPYIKIRWDTLLNPDKEPILSRAILDRPDFDDMHWDIQNSGVTIPANVAAALESRWAKFLAKRGYSPDLIPEEVTTPERYWEGAVRQVTVNAYERNPSARKACIDHYGTTCVVCDFSFAQVYGALGEDFIHVHHVKPLSSVGKKYEIDPVKDLRPICPNCHSMIHYGGETRSIEQLRKIVRRPQ